MSTPKFRIGRLVGGGRVEHAFDIVRRDDGGIAIRNVQKLADHEKFALMAHFGAPVTDLGGGFKDGRHFTKMVTEKPGTEEHFRMAVFQLPAPFELLPGG